MQGLWRLVAGAAAGLVGVTGAFAQSGESAAPLESRLKAHVEFLASDALEGRETGTRGYDMAADYVAREFDAIGLAPGAEGKWFQNIPFRFARRDMKKSSFSLISRSGETRTLVHLEDYVIGRSLAEKTFAREAPAVFVGYGVVDAATNYDDYGSLDVKGKIVVVFGDAPRHFDSEKRAHLADTLIKRRAAAERGAIGLVTLPTLAAEAQSPWDRVIRNVTGAAATWIGQDGKARVVAPEAAAGAFMSAKGGEKLFEGAEKDFAALRKIEAEGGKLPVFELPVRIGLKGGSKFRKVKSANVVALIEGSDGALADEALVVTAHLDHIGKRRPKEKGEDVINNGALDNAIGVAMMIEAARDIADERPRRSVVFVALTGEEKGLLGSDYFARHPTLGDKQIVANVNLDMPLPLSPLKDVIAFGAERTSLGPVVKRTAAEMNVKLTPDPFTEEGIFTRSDHYSFVEQGVPAIFLFTGVEGAARELFDVFMKDRYHQPSDDLTQKIDWKAAADFTELNARIIRALAAGEERPSWNEGDFFGELFAQQDRASERVEAL